METRLFDVLESFPDRVGGTPRPEWMSAITWAYFSDPKNRHPSFLVSINFRSGRQTRSMTPPAGLLMSISDRRVTSPGVGKILFSRSPSSHTRIWLMAPSRALMSASTIFWYNDTAPRRG
jgi:hypothetical protein